MSKLIAYYRVSTKTQGESGLGLDAQRAAVAAHASGAGARIVAEFTEVESGRKSGRPELARALAHAKLAGGKLCIAKIDRLSRNVAFLSALMEAGTPFVACDQPFATPLTIHILAAVAEDEAKRISQRTKVALVAYKTGKRISKRIKTLYPDGVPPDVASETAGKLGAELPQCRNLTPSAIRKGQERGTKTGAVLAADRAAALLPVVVELRRAGHTLKSIAAELNSRGYVTRRGLPFTHVAVLRLLNRDNSIF